MDILGWKTLPAKICVRSLLVVTGILCLLGHNAAHVTPKEDGAVEVHNSNINPVESQTVQTFHHANISRGTSVFVTGRRSNVSRIHGGGGGGHGGKGVPEINADNGRLEQLEPDRSRMFMDAQRAMDQEQGLSAQCKLFSGNWVHDSSYPLYAALQCPYLSGQVNCRRNGRPDTDYEKWRWKPRGCSIPRFNPIDMLQRMKGKRLMFVGDSINRNQWESMVCLLQEVIPSNKKSVVYGDPVTAFRALDYEASVEFFWAPFLVELEINNQKKRILHLDSIANYGMYWKGVDILVFESAHWWTHTGSDQSWDIIMEGKRVYTTIDPMLAYRKGLATWANWITSNVDPRRTLVYFRSMSPKHYSPTEWNEPNGHRCYDEREPVKLMSFSPPVPPQVPILKEILKKMRFPVYLLDITGMSEFRKDAHPSVYSSDFNTVQRRDPDEFADCSHWCLPGVPDTWNQLLYASLITRGLGKG